MKSTNKDQLQEVLPPTIDNPPADLSIMIEKGGEVLGKLFAENVAAQIKIAEINLPVTQKNQSIQEELNKRNWDHIDEERKARINSDKRSFSFALAIVAFLLFIASFLFYQNDKQNAMTIITIVLGFAAGFLSGQGWEKTRQKKSN